MKPRDPNEYTCTYTSIGYSPSVPQLTIYLDREMERRVREAARHEGKSLSRWAGEQLGRAAGAGRWPEGYFELFGSVSDESFREVEELPAAADTVRERL